MTIKYKLLYCKVCKKETERYPRSKSRPNGRLGRCIPCSKRCFKEVAEKFPGTYRKGSRTRSGWARGEHEKAEAERVLRITERREICDCCKSPDPRHKKGWAADHNHLTGKFRGYLCFPCNIIVGFIEKYNILANEQQARYLNVNLETLKEK